MKSRGAAASAARPAPAAGGAAPRVYPRRWHPSPPGGAGGLHAPGARCRAPQPRGSRPGARSPERVTPLARRRGEPRAGPAAAGAAGAGAGAHRRPGQSSPSPGIQQRPCPQTRRPLSAERGLLRWGSAPRGVGRGFPGRAGRAPCAGGAPCLPGCHSGRDPPGPCRAGHGAPPGYGPLRARPRAPDGAGGRPPGCTRRPATVVRSTARRVSPLPCGDLPLPPDGEGGGSRDTAIEGDASEPVPPGRRPSVGAESPGQR